MTNVPLAEPEVYQGQFGTFTITEGDRQGVLIYRSSLMIAALSFAIGVGLILWRSSDPTILQAVSILYSIFVVSLGISLLTIHIYMAALHRVLQVFWAVGAIAALIAAHSDPQPFALTVYQQPLPLIGVGLTFAALTGIFFKEAFCFNRLETKLLTPLLPILILGHLIGWLSLPVEQMLLSIWAGLFVIFALRKLIQAVPADIGDKSVFEYLKQQQVAKA